MLHLYALFAEYIHILCIYTVYIRGTCSLSGGMCGLQHTERIHTAKTKSPGPFCEPSGPERVPGFVFALCAGKWPARRAPCAAQQFLLGLGQLLEGILPAQGGGAARSAPRRGRRGRAHRRSPGPQDGATAPGGPRGPPPTRGPTGPGPRGGSMPARVTAGLPSTGRGPQALLDIRTLFRQGGRG